MWVAAAANALVQAGIRKREAERLATPVTRRVQHEGSDHPVVRRGHFPFPRGLYEYVTCTRPFGDAVVQSLLKSMTGPDRQAFVHEFVPLAARELGYEQRERAARIVRKYIVKEGYDQSSIDVVMRRLSYADICKTSRVKAAIEFPGYARTKKWVRTYEEIRGIGANSLGPAP
jgi:hypothetical protein